MYVLTDSLKVSAKKPRGARAAKQAGKDADGSPFVAKGKAKKQASTNTGGAVGKSEHASRQAFQQERQANPLQSAKPWNRSRIRRRDDEDSDNIAIVKKAKKCPKKGGRK